MRSQSAGRLAGARGLRAAAVSAIMAFAPVGPEASFFDALDRHRASLLAVVKRGAGASPAGATRAASRYSSPRAVEAVSSRPTPEPRSRPPTAPPACNAWVARLGAGDHFPGHTSCF